MYSNYLAIESTIENTIAQRESKMAELAFSQNFLAYYENSDYAKFFLQHENNMLADGEYIIKFEQQSQQATWSAVTGAVTPSLEDSSNLVASPQASWKRFLGEKIAQ